MTTEERLIRAMEFGQQTYISDKLIRAKLENEVFRDVVVRGYQSVMRLTVAGAEVRMPSKEWWGYDNEYLPMWKRVFRRLVPPFLRPITVRHYHVCPHIDPTVGHTEFLTNDDRNT